MLSWDETIFKNFEVFDPEYLPEKILFRESQIGQLVSCLRPAVHGSTPLNAFCIGPPSTGKTSTIRYVIREAKNFKTCYIRCPKFRDPYKIFAKIFESVFGQQAPSGISKVRIVDKVWSRLDEPLVVILDDANLIPKKYVEEVLYEILKVHDEFAVKVGIIVVATDIRFPANLDPFVGAIFHYTEIRYPPYDYEEIKEILKRRVELGFYPNVFDEDAFERVVELSYKAGDLRYGIFLLKAAGSIAESNGKKKVSLEDVEKAHAGEALTFIAKLASALNSEERAVLRIIYSSDTEISTGDLYEVMHREVNMSYRKFYDILEKLERLRLIDIVFGKKGVRGRTRYILKKFDPKVVDRALREF